MRPLGSAWRSLATVLVVVGVLAGCTVGPNYKRPEVLVPADWRNSPERGDSLGDLGWWELFKDPALYELIATAVVANRDLQVAVARVLESRAQLGVARAAQFPQVNAGASYQYTRPFSENSPVLNGSPGRPFTGDDFQTSLDLTFELDLWGRLRRATEAARAELLASEENRRVVLMTLVSDVARTYFDLLELDRELEIARRTLQTREESMQLQRRRLEQGLSTQLDVDRADAEAAVAAATVPDLERRIVQNENGLSVLLGRNPGPIARGTPPDGQRLPPEVPGGLPSALLERRPDIRQAEQTLVAANARIGVAKAEYFPKITLTGVLGVESVALSDLFTGGSRFWSIGPAMTVPVFTAGRTRNTVRGFEAPSSRRPHGICRRSSKHSARSRTPSSSTARFGRSARSASAAWRRTTERSRWSRFATSVGSPANSRFLTSNASSSALSWSSPRPREISSPPWSSYTVRWGADGKVIPHPASTVSNETLRQRCAPCPGTPRTQVSIGGSDEDVYPPRSAVGRPVAGRGERLGPDAWQAARAARPGLVRQFVRAGRATGLRTCRRPAALLLVA
jgi:multidrug efflux system outer membrane protein